MEQPIRIVVHGASGRMGQALLRLAAGDARLQPAAAVTRKPAQRVVDGLPWFAAGEMHGLPAFDVLVDFSQPEALDAVLAECAGRGAALVSGTTGLDETQRHRLSAAASRIPVLWAANFSLGVAMLRRLATLAAAGLAGWDCDIIEQHHAHKRDAPSGTALMLGGAVEAAGTTPRYASVRAGDIVGEHTVQFAAAGERLELVHRATDRDVFARGALHAARWLAGRAPGSYAIDDVLG